MPKGFKSLDPFLNEDGILRVGGRLKHAVKLLIEYQNKKNHNWGQELLLSTLRQTYWLINGRSFVRSVAKAWIYCKRKNPTSMQPKMADLPDVRLAIASPPFSNTGIDFFGPMMVKVLRSRAKRWGCLLYTSPSPRDS